MELPLPLSADPGAMEESDLTASASSSSLRLSNLSSSSRRFRHISPPFSRLGSQKKGLGTSQSQLTPQKPTYTETPYNTVTVSTSSLSVVPSDEVDRTSVQTTTVVTQVYKILRASVFLWKWVCFGYFCVAIFDQLRYMTADWHKSRPPDLKGYLNDPESILSTFPLEHRLSKLSSLHPIPLSLKPFLLGPRENSDSITACIWTNESGLSLIQEWSFSWSGPISLLVTHSAPPSSIAYKELFTRLDSLSQMAPNISFHTLYTSSSLRNFNAYINIARLFSPGPKVLLFPPSTLTSWGSLPQSSAVLLNTRKEDEQFIIPSSPLRFSNNQSVDILRNVFFPTSALLLDRESSPWCTERLFTIMNDQLASNIEMGLHWRECIWNIWLRSHGKIQLLNYKGWSDTAAQSLVTESDALPESAESNLCTRLARKQRSETCFLVAREMIALGEWFALGTSQLEATGEIAGGEGDGEAKPVQIESTQAKWLKSVCRETLERWVKELIMD